VSENRLFQADVPDAWLEFESEYQSGTAGPGLEESSPSEGRLRAFAASAPANDRVSRRVSTALSRAEDREALSQFASESNARLPLDTIGAAALSESRRAAAPAVAMTVVFGTAAVLSLSTFASPNRPTVHSFTAVDASYRMPPVSEGIPAALLANLTRVEIALPTLSVAPVRPGAAMRSAAVAATSTTSDPIQRNRRPTSVPAEAQVALPRPPAARSAAAEDEQRIRTAIRAYERAFERLDVEATADIWPSVDQRALGRAFGTLRSQGLQIADCGITVNGAEATARCLGTLEFVPKIGRQERIVSPQLWTFSLRRRGRGWRIENVSAIPRTAAADPQQRAPQENAP
jgi:hypothetical protein